MSDHGCCAASDNGFRCTCIKTPHRCSRQAEDDGYGDWLRDQKKDREIEEARGNE